MMEYFLKSPLSIKVRNSPEFFLFLRQGKEDCCYGYKWNKTTHHCESMYKSKMRSVRITKRSKVDGWMDGLLYGRTDRRTDGRMDCARKGEELGQNECMV